MRLPKLPRWAWTILVLAICLLALFAAFPSLPSDKSLRSHFLDHRADFETLLSMIQQDRTVNVIWPKEMEMTGPKADSSYIPYPPSALGFPADRFAKYQQLLKAIGAKILIRHEDNSISLGTGGWGFASYGVRWGYTWMPNPPDKKYLIASMDDLRQSFKDKPTAHGKDVLRFCPLEDHWYIMFQG